MDPFWCITLGTLVVARFWKREKRKNKERRYEKEEHNKRVEQAKQDEVIAKYSAVFGAPMSKEEKEAIAAKRQRDKEVEELRKQGYTDELIAVILPTINNGQ